MAWFGGGKKKTGERKVLRVGMLHAVHELDPRRTQELGSVLVLSQVFEPPYALPTADAAPEPLLFTGPLQVEEGGLVVSGQVRAGVKFSDGTALTAAHAAASLASTEVVARAASVEARGDRVVFRLKRPNPRFDVVLAQSYSSIVLAKNGPNQDGTILGTGPFVVTAGVGAEVLRLSRNEHYRQTVPLDEVEFSTYASADALIAAVEGGQVDFTSALSRDEVGKIREARKLFLPGASTSILYLNCERPALQNVDVRRAIGAAVDRTEVTRTNYSNALAFAASSLLPPVMGTYRDAIAYNPERARELMRASGGVSERLRMLLVWGPRPYLPQPRTAATVIARQLADVGLQVEVVPTSDVEEYNGKVRTGDYDLLLSGWIADTLDAADYLDANLSSELIPSATAPPINRANRSRWRDVTMDEALARFRELRSEDARSSVLQRLAEQLPLLPGMYGPTVVVHSWRVQNFEPSPLGLPSLAGVDVQGA
jgi:cationic peptide transport system substrate-binding protein